MRLLLLAAMLIATPTLAAERGFPVGDFHGIALSGSPDVVVTTGRTASVHATGSEEALDRLEIRVEDGTLKIGNKRGLDWSWRDHGPVRIAVGVPMIRAIAVAGSGDVKADRIKVKDFAAAIAGSGDITIAALDADATSFAVSGSGDVTAAGRCGAGVVKLAGSGDMKFGGLKCETLSVNVAGSGDVAAFASRTANVAIRGSGDVTVTGGGRCTVSTTGSGKAHCS
jgi:hypothetical protein